MAFGTGFVLVLCQVVLIRSFLMNSTASTRITSYEFQLLSKLNLDEQTRISRLEDDVRSLVKDQQVLKDANAQLNQELNASKAELDREIANRHQLQVAYSTISSKLNNLSLLVNSNTVDIGKLSHKTGKFIKDSYISPIRPFTL